MSISKINTNSIAAGASPTITDLTLSGSLFLGGTGGANELSDYEEGTFTPTFSDSTNVSNFSLSHARYIKIGKQVFCVVYLTADVASSTATTVFSIEVPFTRGGNYTIMGSGVCNNGETTGGGAIFSGNSGRVYVSFGALGLGVTGNQTFHLAVQYEST